MNITGVLLAGGASRRYGEPKAFATYQGKSFYQWALEALQPYTDHIIIVSHPDLYDRFVKDASCNVVQDDPRFQGLGPLAGIYSAMKAMAADWYCVLACD